MAEIKRVWAAFTGHLWAIEESKLRAIEQVLRLKIAGETVDFQAAQRPKPAPPSASIAVIPITGTISHRMNMFSEFSGGTSTEALAASFREALQNPDVEAIVFDVDSPGGDVAGTMELAEEIFQARGKKRMMAVANSRAGSAALWLAVAADEFVAIPSAQVGSIGVFAVHEDRSELNAKVGIKPTYIRSSPEKTELSPDAPLADEALAHVQAQVNEVATVFRAFVAKARGVSTEDVVEKFGNGRMLLAKAAKRAGLVDRVATWDEALRHVSKTASKRSVSAVSGVAAITATSRPDGESCETCHGSGLLPEKYMGDPEGQKPCPDCAAGEAEKNRQESQSTAAAQRDLDEIDMALALGPW
jgi:signal peptide peptidase SppA